MAIWFSGFQGDNAGPIVGREHNRLLVAMTLSNDTEPDGIEAHVEEGGLDVYPNLRVMCLTPGARPATAVNLVWPGDTLLSIGVAEIDVGDGAAPWGPGVHLFSVAISGNGSNLEAHGFTTTIATAVIDGKVPKLDRSEPVVGEGNG